MPWQSRIWQMMGQPVGVSFRDGTGTSGILCEVRANTLFIIEYLYQEQFALKQYPIGTIQNVLSFPPCQYNQFPGGGFNPWSGPVVY